MSEDFGRFSHLVAKAKEQAALQAEVKQSEKIVEKVEVKLSQNNHIEEHVKTNKSTKCHTKCGKCGKCHDNKCSRLVSPNGKLIVDVKLSQGVLTYQVSDNTGKVIIRPSSLGVIRADSDFSQNLVYVSKKVWKNTTLSYVNPLGKFSSQTFLGTKAELTYANPDHVKITVEFFITDFAVNFRYGFLHERKGLMIDVKKETTTTNIPLQNSNGTATQTLFRPFAPQNMGAIHNYFEYQQSDVGTSFPLVPYFPFVPNQVAVALELPMYFKYDDYNIIVLQSGVSRDNSQQHFDGDATGGVYKWSNTLPEGQFIPTQLDSLMPSKVEVYDTTSQLPWYSVWHILYVTKNISDVQNDLVYALGNDEGVKDVSWIVPGRSSWNYVFNNPAQFPIPEPIYNIVSASRDANGVVTITTSTPNNYYLGAAVTVIMTNPADSSFNVQNSYVTPLSATQFTYLKSGPVQNSVDGGTVQITTLNSLNNFNAAKQFMDVASFFGWPYVTFDVRWPWMSNIPGVSNQNCTCNKLDGNRVTSCTACTAWDWNGTNAPTFSRRRTVATAIANYGASLNPPVKAFLWYDAPLGKITAGTFDDTYGLDNYPNLLVSKLRNNEFQMLQNAKIAGVKFDFQNLETQMPTINMLDILRDAATYKLLINSHDFNMPCGLEKAYPNLITNKFYWGTEWWDYSQLFTQYIPLATHLIRSYYLQAITGPMDMTPSLLLRLTGPASANDRYLLRDTTGAFMLACQLLYFSPLQTMADAPSTYTTVATDIPAIDDFLRNSPTVWDETKHLYGTLLDQTDLGSTVAVVARRKGTTWYIGGGVGSDAGIQSAVRDNNGEVIMKTFIANGFKVGDPINVYFANAANKSFNGNFVITQVDSPIQFRYMQAPGSPLASIPFDGGIVYRTLPETINLNLSSLGLNGNHSVTQILDGSDPYGTDPNTVFTVVQSNINFPTALNVTMAPDGGFVMKIE